MSTLCSGRRRRPVLCSVFDSASLYSFLSYILSVCLCIATALLPARVCLAIWPLLAVLAFVCVLRCNGRVMLSVKGRVLSVLRNIDLVIHAAWKFLYCDHSQSVCIQCSGQSMCVAIDAHIRRVQRFPVVTLPPVAFM